MGNTDGQAGSNRLIRLLVYFFSYLGFLMFTVTITPLVSWWGGELAGPWNDPKGDVLIVLGGSMGERGILGGNSYLRAEYAILAFREGGFRLVVLSGGGAHRPVSEAMRDFLSCQGVPRDAVLTESASSSTRENALFTKQLVENAPGKKVLMTSDFHMFRAYHVFRKAGLDVVPRPIPDVRKRGAEWKGRWPAFVDLVQETAKIGYYFVRGWI